MDIISQTIIENLDGFAKLIMPVMFAGFILGVMVRWLIFYTARLELRFSREFEKRVKIHFSDPKAQRIDSFYALLKKTLDRTFFEVFDIKNKHTRRQMEHLTTLTDRIFLLQDGVQRLVQDTLKQARYLKRDGTPPKMIEVSKSVFENNPVFTKLMGIIPTSLAHEVINILPGLFIIGGIFGTFLGIAKGLPELGGMDLENMAETKRTMDLFLIAISQAMVKSIVGIGLSVAMSLVNTFLAPESTYYGLVNKYAAALEHLWNETRNNDYTAAMDAPVAAAPAASAPPALPKAS